MCGGGYALVIEARRDIDAVYRGNRRRPVVCWAVRRFENGEVEVMGLVTPGRGSDGSLIEVGADPEFSHYEEKKERKDDGLHRRLDEKKEERGWADSL